MLKKNVVGDRQYPHKSKHQHNTTKNQNLKKVESTYREQLAPQRTSTYERPFTHEDNYLVGLSDSYHNLASPIKVKQNLCTFMLSRKSCVSIQSLILSKWASASSSGLPANLGLKWDQFNCALCGAPGTRGALGRNGLFGGGFCPWLLSWALP